MTMTNPTSRSLTEEEIRDAWRRGRDRWPKGEPVLRVAVRGPVPPPLSQEPVICQAEPMRVAAFEKIREFNGPLVTERVVCGPLVLEEEIRRRGL